MTLVADFNTAVSVPFSRMRQLLEDSGRLVEGVCGNTHLAVAQRGAGANMSVDVAAGQAWVEIDTGTRNGYGHVTNDALANVVVTASNGTNPRIDQVVLQWNETGIPTGSGDVPTLAVLAGTATAGATLVNRTGAAALGNDRLLLADLLIPTSSTSVITANIADRRPSAVAPGSFSVYRAGALSLATGAQVTFETKEWDASNWYDAVTNARFTPQIAGYYRLSWAVKSSALAADQWWMASLAKNGTKIKEGQIVWERAAVNANSTGSVLAVANGTTDFFTVLIEHNVGSATALTVGQTVTFFQGELIGKS